MIVINDFLTFVALLLTSSVSSCLQSDKQMCLSQTSSSLPPLSSVLVEEPTRAKRLVLCIREEQSDRDMEEIKVIISNTMMYIVAG